jgi:predicted nucleotidyltransferase
VGDLHVIVAEIARALTQAHIQSMVIGGVANAVWGNPRATIDVDLTIACAPEEYPRVLAALGSFVAKLPPNLEEHLANGVLPFIHRSGIQVDLILSRHPYAQQALDRAVTVRIENVPVKFCTPEDLILHKIISDREKDRSDVADLLRRRRETLDLSYLEPRVRELAHLLERPEIEERLRAGLA